MLYLDSSALVKLVLLEAESAALAATVSREDAIASSALAVVEVQRAVRRMTDTPDAIERAKLVLALTELVQPTDAVLQTAAGLAPPAIRSLDAIHLASALHLGGDLSGFVAYDDRLSGAARAAGLPASMPT